MSARVVTEEILDGLPNHHPAARRSRRDLSRVHCAMGTRSIVVRALRSSQLAARSQTRLRVLEIGAGDGKVMCRVAQSLGSAWRNVELTLLDRIDLVEAATITRFAALGWQVETMVTDVMRWADDATASQMTLEAKRWDIIIANLFLHHFEGKQLTGLLTAIEARTNCFFACEPRRSWVASVGSHLIGALFVNAVTRADAVTSVRAGFRNAEISGFWPSGIDRWTVKEYPAGLFSQCFCAERKSMPAAADKDHAA